MRRRFSKRQRRVLAWVAAGKCQLCGAPLSERFHADHVVPFCIGGPTLTENGQALCPQCNLGKGSK
jgi:5-methylcytosine-specific restriction endonuclease McrA